MAPTVLSQKDQKTIQLSKTEGSAFAKTAFFLLAGFLCGGFDVGQELSPFGFGLLSACPLPMGFACLLGCCLGFLLKMGLSSVRYLLCFGLILALRYPFQHRFSKIGERYFCCACAFTVPALFSLAQLILNQLSWEDLILSLIEPLISFGVCYLYDTAFRLPIFSVGLAQMKKRERVSILVSLCSLLCCACGYEVVLLRPFLFAAFFSILLFSHYKGSESGCVYGLALGVGLCFLPKSRFLFSYCALGGFAAGCLQAPGRISSSLAFVISCGGVCAFNGFSTESIIAFLQAAVSASVFLAMPASLLQKIEDGLDRCGFCGGQMKKVDFEPSLLSTAESCMKEVSELFSDVSTALQQMVYPQMNKIYAYIQRDVCSHCQQQSQCWGKDFPKTAKVVSAMAEGNFALSDYCCQREQLELSIRKNRQAYWDSLGIQLRLDELRHIAGLQFSAAASLFSDLCQRQNEPAQTDMQKSLRVKHELEKSGYEVIHAQLGIRRSGKAELKLNLYAFLEELDCDRIRHILSECTLIEWESPEIIPDENSVRLYFTQKECLTFTYACASHPSCDGCTCGDTTECFRDYDSNTVAILSDGMSTGIFAAVDSNLACSLMKKMLCAGFSYENALQTVNTALMIKSGEESLATLDIVSLNPFTGQCEFYKAGAASAYLKRGKTIHGFTACNMPAGILQDIAFDRQVCYVQHGDVIVLFSDGVGDIAMITRELSAWSSEDMKALSRHLADLSKDRASTHQRDDISVIALRVKDSEFSTFRKEAEQDYIKFRQE